MAKRPFDVAVPGRRGTPIQRGRIERRADRARSYPFGPGITPATSSRIR